MARNDRTLAIEVTDDLFVQILQLAERRIGDSGDRAIGQIVAEALDLWAVSRQSNETRPGDAEEPVALWSRASEGAQSEPDVLVRTWLFGRDR